MTSPGAEPARRRPFRGWKGVAGVLLSAGLLWYAFRDVHLAEVWAEIRTANLPLLGLAAFLVTVPFAFRAARWGVLLHPMYARSGFRNRFACTTIGFMANNLLPARVGEFARAYALTRLEPVRLSGSFGSLVTERMFDAVLVIGLLLLALAWPGFPVGGRVFVHTALVLAAVLTLGFVLLLALALRPDASGRFLERAAERTLPARLRRRVIDTLLAFLHGTAAIADWRLVLPALAWSVAVWMTVAVATWVGFRAFGIELPFVAALFLQSIIALAVSLPAAPGFFGVFEAAARVGLVDVWGVEVSSAMAFALGFHLAGYFPVTFIGLYYLWRLDFTWGDVGRSEEVVESAVEAAVDAPPPPADPHPG